MKIAFCTFKCEELLRVNPRTVFAPHNTIHKVVYGKLENERGFIMGNSVQKILRVGENMAKKIGRTYRSTNASGLVEFTGTKQVLNGQTVVNGRISYYGGRERYLTKISTQTQNGSKEVSRIVPDLETRFTYDGDITKITTNTNSQVGTHSVNTFNQKSYEYGNCGLGIYERTIDRVFAGRKHLGGRAVFSGMSECSITPQKKKVFFGADGKPLKTVYYNSRTGLRSFAELPDGRVIRYDEKGLPVFTDAQYCKKINLGGLDKLI